MTDITPAAEDYRVVRSKQRVLQETHKLLAQAGIGGMSIDEVSRRSGVAKTTIYRHWQTRSLLLIEACSHMVVSPAARPATGTLEGDLTVLAGQIAADLDDAKSPWPLALPSIIDAAERDRDLADVQARLQAKLVQPFIQAIGDGKDRGELDRDRDAATLVAAIIGPLVYRRWFSREPLDPGFVSDVVTQALR